MAVTFHGHDHNNDTKQPDKNRHNTPLPDHSESPNPTKPDSLRGHASTSKQSTQSVPNKTAKPSSRSNTMIIKSIRYITPSHQVRQLAWNTHSAILIINNPETLKFLPSSETRRMSLKQMSCSELLSWFRSTSLPSALLLYQSWWMIE